jgi:hypothetical protein
LLPEIRFFGVVDSTTVWATHINHVGLLASEFFFIQTHKKLKPRTGLATFEQLRAAISTFVRPPSAKRLVVDPVTDCHLFFFGERKKHRVTFPLTNCNTTPIYGWGIYVWHLRQIGDVHIVPLNTFARFRRERGHNTFCPKASHPV